MPRNQQATRTEAARHFVVVIGGAVRHVEKRAQATAVYIMRLDAHDLAEGVECFDDRGRESMQYVLGMLHWRGDAFADFHRRVTVARRIVHEVRGARDRVAKLRRRIVASKEEIAALEKLMRGPWHDEDPETGEVAEKQDPPRWY